MRKFTLEMRIREEKEDESPGVLHSILVRRNKKYYETSNIRSLYIFQQNKY